MRKLGIAAIAVLVVVPVVLGIGILIAMWRTWWLHPLWALLFVPLGYPQITYWHFMGLMFFITAFQTHNTSSSEKMKSGEKTGTASFNFLWPIFIYYAVTWFMR
jgi:hypothetical protein